MANLLVALGEMDQHEAAAADVAGARIGHRHREADRDRGIDRVAAALEHLDADARRARLLRHHHAVARGDRRNARQFDAAAPRCARARPPPRQRQRAPASSARRLIPIMARAYPKPGGGGTVRSTTKNFAGG